MRILIADDEKLTREGIANGIAWDTLGIADILLAADGQEALRQGEQNAPDILLTDVRMPHLDGIALAKQLQQRYPQMSIVFMSGYSDREYLKEAIRLRAVSFVEKPIDLAEVTQVITDAVGLVKEQQKKAEYTSFSREKQESELAAALLSPGVDPETLQGLTVFQKHTGGRPEACFVMLVQCYDRSQPQQAAKALHEEAALVLERFGLDEIHTVRRQSILVYHLFSAECISRSVLLTLGEELKSRFQRTGISFHILFGSIEKAPDQLYVSYEAAVVALQDAFFHPENRLLFSGDLSRRQSFRDLSGLEAEEAYRAALGALDQEKALLTLRSLLSQLTSCGDILPWQVKDYYYRLFQTLKNAAGTRLIELSYFSENPNLMETVAAAVSVFWLDENLTGATKEYFAAASQKASAPSASAMIRFYIENHYASGSLSVKEISDYMHLSPTYLCTLFKNETGTTLNQYITEFRMRRARELLLDPRNRVQEIAEAVGFSDSNYFSKAFKKQFGVSPSEFRGL